MVKAVVFLAKRYSELYIPNPSFNPCLLKIVEEC